MKGVDINSIPSHWRWVTLNDIGIVISGGTPSTKEPEFWNGDIPWITPADLSNFNEVYISKGNRNISEIGLDYSSAYLLPENSIVFSSRAPIGYVAITKNKLATNQGFKNLILPNNLVNPKYVYYYLKTVKEVAESMASGTTFLELSATKFKKIPIPLCSLVAQNEIVIRIEESLSIINKSIDELDNTLKLIELQRKNILKTILKRNTNSHIKLKEITTKITDGTHHTPKYVKEGIHFISVKDIKDGVIDFSNTKFISPKEHKLLSKRCNPELGDVLITKSGTIGRLAIVPESPEFSLFVSVALIKIKKDKIDSRFLFFCLQNFVNSLNVKKDIKGAVQKNFHLEDIREVEIPYADLQKQSEIAQDIANQMNGLDDLYNEVKQIKLGKEQLVKKILRDAFQGKFKIIEETTDIENLINDLQTAKKIFIENELKIKKNKKKLARININLVEIIKKNFNKNYFSYFQLFQNSNLSKEKFKFEFDILEKEGEIISYFDSKNGTLKYILNENKKPNNT